MTKTVLIVPCYNEAKRLNPAVFKLFLDNHPEFAVCFVNDGSSDGTESLLRKIAKESKQISLVSYQKNKGKANAIREGVLYALANLEFDIIGYWDADLAVKLEELPRMLKRFAKNQELQILLGSRVKLLGYAIRRNVWRHYLGRIFATAASALLGLAVYDTQCGAKLFRRAFAEIIFQEPLRTKWIFDLELLLRGRRILERAGDDQLECFINEIPVYYWDEVAGSKVKPYHYFSALFDFGRLALLKLRKSR